VWQVSRDGVVEGPYTWRAIERQVLQGKLSADDRVRCAGGAWQALREIFSSLSPTTETEGRLPNRPDKKSVDSASRATALWSTLSDSQAGRSSYVPLLAIVLVLSVAFAAAVGIATPNSGPEIRCYESTFADRRLDSCNMVEWDASGKNLESLSGRNADLSLANLSNARLRGSDLSYAKAPEADLRFADLSGAVLVGIDLRGAKLAHASFSGADLRYADLRGALSNGTDFAGALLGNARWMDGRTCAPESNGACSD
jgi:uncharacterized protein YjbI with pentapeptide repeats